MLILVVAFLLAVMLASVRVKGPIWALCIAWLISLLPIATGVIAFPYLQDRDLTYSFILIALLSCFLGGAALYHAVPHRTVQVRPDATPPLSRGGMQRAWLCWWAGIIGAGCIITDFLLLGGAGLSDLATLRDNFVEKTSASIFAQLGSILTWGCLYCFIFALLLRQRLNRVTFAVLLLPIFGYFLISLLSAGRQAAFQVMVVTILIIVAIKSRERLRVPRTAEVPKRRGSALLVAGVSSAMIAYMGYIAVARNDNTISDSKADVLIALFDLRLSGLAETVGAFLGETLKSVTVEALVYFSASMALFEKFLTLRFLDHSYGAMTFPFFFRQLQSFTGISPTEFMILRVDGLNEAGVIGAGWTTALSSYLMDFGAAGTAAFLFVMGYYSAYAWRKALTSNYFEDVVIGILVLISAIYMPLLPALSDNNLLILWLFCLGVKLMRALGRYPRPVGLGRAAAFQ